MLILLWGYHPNSPFFGSICKAHIRLDMRLFYTCKWKEIEASLLTRVLVAI